MSAVLVFCLVGWSALVDLPSPRQIFRSRLTKILTLSAVLLTNYSLLLFQPLLQSLLILPQRTLLCLCHRQNLLKLPDLINEVLVAVAAERCRLRLFVRDVGKGNKGGSFTQGRIVLASPHFRLLKTAKKKQINFSSGLPRERLGSRNGNGLNEFYDFGED